MEKNNSNFWLGRKAKIVVLIDGQRLFYTANIIEVDPVSISFLDKDGVLYSFRREQIEQMTEIRGGRR